MNIFAVKQSHTIILIQRSASDNSRTYIEQPNPGAAIAGTYWMGHRIACY